MIITDPKTLEMEIKLENLLRLPVMIDTATVFNSQQTTILKVSVASATEKEVADAMSTLGILYPFIVITNPESIAPGATNDWHNE